MLKQARVCSSDGPGRKGTIVFENQTILAFITSLFLVLVGPGFSRSCILEKIAFYFKYSPVKSTLKVDNHKEEGQELEINLLLRRRLSSDIVYLVTGPFFFCPL